MLQLNEGHAPQARQAQLVVYIKLHCYQFIAWEWESEKVKDHSKQVTMLASCSLLTINNVTILLCSLSLHAYINQEFSLYKYAVEDVHKLFILPYIERKLFCFDNNESKTN